MAGRPLAIDLFAGCGGLSLGLEQAGFDPAAAVEIDPVHSAVHAFNFPMAHVLCRDAKTLSGRDIMACLPAGAETALVAGGSPCQGFSLIGRRLLDDPRNALLGRFARLVCEIQPRFCLLENVKGLSVGKHARLLEELVLELERGGYAVERKVLNAMDFGVPQSRERLFVVGRRRGEKPFAWPEPLPERPCVRDAIGDLPDADLFPELLESDCADAGWRTEAKYARILRGLESDPEDFSHPRTNVRTGLTSSMRTVHAEESKRRFLAAPCGSVEPRSRLFKPAWDGVCRTLRAGSDSAHGAHTAPRPIHPELPRLLTVRECARLHGYPDWFRFHRTKWHGCMEIGNSVPPPLARALGRQIMQALGIAPCRPAEAVPCGDERLLAMAQREAARHFGL